MSNTPIPDTIAAICAQCGRGINGAFAYVGASQYVYSCPQQSGSVRSRYHSKVRPDGLIDKDVNLTFSVNGKRGQTWKMVIVYEPNDTYTVYLWRSARRNAIDDYAAMQQGASLGEVLAEHRDVYAEDLKEVVKATYDRAIEKYASGMIPV